MRVTVIDTPQLPDGQEAVLLDTHGVPAGIVALSLIAEDDDIPGLGHVWAGPYGRFEDPFSLIGDALLVKLYSCSPAEPGDVFDFPLVNVREAAERYLDTGPRFGICLCGPTNNLLPALRDVLPSRWGNIRAAVWMVLCLPGFSAASLLDALRFAEGMGPCDPAWSIVDPFPVVVETSPVVEERGDDWWDEDVPRWSAWSAVRTSVGKARYRTKTLWADAHYDSGVFEIAFGGRVWTGSDSGCVDGSQSFSVDAVHAAETPLIDLVGQRHARSLKDFIRYALPLLVKGEQSAADVGQPESEFLDEVVSC